MAPFIRPAIPKVDDQFHRLANASVGKVDGFGRYNGYFKDTTEQNE